MFGHESLQIIVEIFDRSIRVIIAIDDPEEWFIRNSIIITKCASEETQGLGLS